MNPSDKIIVCLCAVFGAPFFLAGLGIVGAGVYQIAGQQPPNWVAGATLAVFGVVFGLIGLYVMSHGRRRVRQANAARARLEANKDTPWALREDWARGVVRCSSKAAMLTAWGFAIVWNLLSAPIPLVMWKEVMEKENYVVLLASLFPIIGVCSVFWAIRATLRYKKFGVSELHLRAVPAQPGAFLAGVVRVKAQLEPSDGYHVKLTCIHRTVTGSGKHRSTHEEVLWQEQHVVDRELKGGDLMTTQMPISLALPEDASETTIDNPRDRVFWLLEVSADVFGVDYAAKFEVPVFRTDRVAQLVDDYVDGEDWAADYRRPVDRSSGAVWAGERESGVRVERRAQGVKEFYFPPGRNVGAAIGLTCFTAVWSGFIWIMLELGAPVLFPVFFGLFDALLIVACASMWLGSTRTLIDGRTITVQSRILGIGSTKRIQVGEIDGVDLSIGMQSGRTPYYDIIVRCRDGRKVSLGSSIKDKREAERILDEMKGCLPDVQTDPLSEETVEKVVALARRTADGARFLPAIDATPEQVIAALSTAKVLQRVIRDACDLIAGVAAGDP